MCVCQFDAPVTPLRLRKPVITNVSLSEARFSDWREAAHLEWSPPSTDSIGIRSYTLFRKTQSDSLFDVFTRSQGIPDSVTSFYDDLTPIGFPGDSFLLVEYRICAIDMLGRPGDTSAPCSLYLAPQPGLTSIDSTAWCLGWESSHIQAPVTSRIKVWNSANNRSWTSRDSTAFGNENIPQLFLACMPDSLKPAHSDTLFFAIFLNANSRQSLKVGAIYVP